MLSIRKLILVMLLLAMQPTTLIADTNIDKPKAVEMAKQKYKGRVLKVEHHNSKYRIKMLQKTGRVVSVDVDKKSGKVSQAQSQKKGK